MGVEQVKSFRQEKAGLDLGIGINKLEDWTELLGKGKEGLPPGKVSLVPVTPVGKSGAGRMRRRSSGV